jgi:hypothetical protein
MAARIPLVIVNGQVEQLQAGDSITVASAQYSSDVFTNGHASDPLVICTPVFMKGANEADFAQANALATSGVVGLWLDASTAAGDTGICVLSGRMVATTGQWDAVAGTTGGLAPGVLYFLSPTTKGKITSVAPTAVGQVVMPIGRAISPTDMELLDNRTILL